MKIILHCGPQKYVHLTTTPPPLDYSLNPQKKIVSSYTDFLLFLKYLKLSRHLLSREMTQRGLIWSPTESGRGQGERRNTTETWQSCLGWS